MPSDPGGKSSFIAAARRATQAAGTDIGPRSSAHTSGEIAFTAGKLATRLDRWRTLVIGVGALALVLGSAQLARTWLSAGEEAEPGSATPWLVAAAPVAVPADAALAQEPKLPVPAALPAPPAPLPPAASHQAPIVSAVEGTPWPPTVAVDRARETMPVAMAATEADVAPAATPGDIELPAAFGSVLLTAVAKGDAGAQYEVALRYFEGRGVAQDVRAAAEWLERSAGQGLAAAQFRLGGLYEKGLGVTTDLEAARRYYLAAASAGHGKAMHNLAVLYAEGTERRPDYKAAAAWFRRAANLRDCR